MGLNDRRIARSHSVLKEPGPRSCISRPTPRACFIHVLQLSVVAVPANNYTHIRNGIDLIGPARGMQAALTSKWQRIMAEVKVSGVFHSVGWLSACCSIQSDCPYRVRDCANSPSSWWFRPSSCNAKAQLARSSDGFCPRCEAVCWNQVPSTTISLSGCDSSRLFISMPMNWALSSRGGINGAVLSCANADWSFSYDVKKRCCG